jgi:hypothetical protein
MALDQLVGSTTQNGPMFLGNGMFQPGPGTDIGGLGGLRNRLIERRDHIGNGIYNNPPPLMSIDGPGLIAQPGPGYIGDGYNNRPFRPMPLPDYNIGRLPPTLGIAQPDYSGQFEKFGEQLTGFGDQMTGYQDALGSFNEQMGGMGKQFETINNRLDSVDKGLGSLGNQIASFENMQKAQPQEVMQPQRPAFSPFGFGGFGGLGSLFGRRY